jgi:hypothetical protein
MVTQDVVEIAGGRPARIDVRMRINERNPADFGVDLASRRIIKNKMFSSVVLSQ